MSNDNNKPIQLKSPEQFKANLEKYRRDINARNTRQMKRRDKTSSCTDTEKQNQKEATVLQFKRKEPK